jgi:asparagine synthase (glutamine-hydrolysing)
MPVSPLSVRPRTCGYCGAEWLKRTRQALEPHVSKRYCTAPSRASPYPLAAWFRGPLRRCLRDTLCGPVLRESGLFDMGTLATVLDQHQSGERDHSAALWTLSMMESFLRQADGGGRRTETIPETVGTIV